MRTKTIYKKRSSVKLPHLKGIPTRLALLKLEVVRNNKCQHDSYESSNLRNEQKKTNVTSKSSIINIHDIKNNENI